MGPLVLTRWSSSDVKTLETVMVLPAAKFQSSVVSSPESPLAIVRVVSRMGWLCVVDREGSGRWFLGVGLWVVVSAVGKETKFH